MDDLSNPTPGGRMKSNMAAALAYVTFIPAVIFLAVEPYRSDGLVRFHSWQSLFYWIMTFIIDVILRLVPMPLVGWIVWDIVQVLLAILWIIAVLKALQGERWRMPLVGGYAERQSSRGAI